MTKNRDQGSEIGNQEHDRMKQLLQGALSSVGDQPELPRDLWPAMLRRLDEQSMRSATGVPWFDWALAGGLLAFAAIAPRTIPVILYYL